MSPIAEHAPFLRVEEAAGLLRISRTSAYELARRWIESDGREGPQPCAWDAPSVSRPPRSSAWRAIAKLMIRDRDALKRPPPPTVT